MASRPDSLFWSSRLSHEGRGAAKAPQCFGGGVVRSAAGLPIADGFAEINVDDQARGMPDDSLAMRRAQRHDKVRQLVGG
jgi:hypothetical protein